MLNRKIIQTFFARTLPVLCGGLYLALTIRSALAWAPALDPVALWHDDLWVALLTRMPSVLDMFRVNIPIPPGFLLLCRISAGTINDPELPLQLPAFIAGLLCIPAMGLLAQRITGNRWAGLLGAALIASNHWLAFYAVRVKPYTLDTLITAVLLLLGHAVLSKPSSRRTLILVVATIWAAMFSFPSLLTSGLLLLATMYTGFRMRTADRARAGRIMTYSIGGILLLGGWYLNAQGKGNAPLKAFWGSCFAPEHNPVESIRFILGATSTMIRTAMPTAIPFLGFLAALALVMMVLNKKERIFGGFLFFFYLSILIANVLRIYPLGPVRLHLFTFPATIALVCFGIHRIRELLHIKDRWQIVLAVMACLFAFSFPVHPGYPGFKVFPPVAALEQAASDEDTLLLHPAAGRVVSYYGSWPIRFVEMPDRLLQFSAVIDRDHLILTGGSLMTIYDHVRDALDKTSPIRVLYYGIDSIGAPQPGRMYTANNTILNALTDSGYIQEKVIAETPGTKITSFRQIKDP